MSNKKDKKYGSDLEETTENEFSEIEPVKQQSSVKYRGKENQQQTKETHSSVSSDDKDIRNIPISVKYQNFIQRTIWSFLLLVAFFGIILAGHIYCALFVLLITIGVFNEIISLKRYREKDLQIPLFLTINWYFFIVGVFFFYGKLLSLKLTKIVFTNPYIQFIATYHNLISFMAWIIGFLGFVLSLKKGYYRYQFRIFGWAHLTIILIVAQTSSIILNMYEGLIWFILPCVLVISNDTFAYIFGRLFGKTQLIEISPKKTVEGFIGGVISTFFFGILGSHFLQQFKYLICPQYELIFTPFQTHTCEASYLFIQQPYDLPSIFQYIGFSQIYLSNFQFHVLTLSLFASLIAPFGGFFASGFKRAIKIKDFADIIPGHGGITDRMDCEILMGMFTYLYLHQVILGGLSSSNITHYLGQLDSNDQLTLYYELQKILYRKQLLNSTITI